jgi:uncharacterized RDD family membrane protein YckC
VPIPWIYNAAMESSRKQGTFGKMALSIAVTDMSGRRVSFGKASSRHFSKFLSMFFLGIGFLMASFTERKQALHDMVAGCMVVVKE